MYSPDPPPEPEPNRPQPPSFKAADLVNVGLKGQHRVVAMKDDYQSLSGTTIKQGTRGIARWPDGSGHRSGFIELHLPRGTVFLNPVRGANDVINVPILSVDILGYVNL